jgi:6-phosphogluconolactonase
MPGTARSDTRLRRYPDRAALSEALAARIVGALEDGMRGGGSASLVVSGGRSPAALFDMLSSAALDWRRVWIALADERWVDTTSSDSNEHLVREHLLRNAAAKANFVGMKTDAAQPAEAAGSSWSAIAPLPRPFDYVLLGMGDDGHTASLFPQSPGLASAIDPLQPPGCVAMIAPVAPQARMSLNLSALLNARRIELLIIGDGKLAVYERAGESGPVADMPVRALLRQQRVPVSVCWAP